MNDHDGLGVIPGRYAGEAIRLHDGPTPQALAHEEERSHADALAAGFAPRRPMWPDRMIQSSC